MKKSFFYFLIVMALFIISANFVFAETPTYIRSNYVASFTLDLDIGSASSSRLVLIGVHAETTTFIEPIEISVDGNNCPRVIRGVNNDTAGSFNSLFYCNENHLKNSAGTVKISENSGQCSDDVCGISASLFYGVSPESPFESGIDTKIFNNDDAYDMALTVPTSSLVYIQATYGSTGSFFGWTSPLSEIIDNDIILGSSPYGVAWGVESTNQDNKTYSVQTTASPIIGRGNMIGVVFKNYQDIVVATSSLATTSSVMTLETGNLNQITNYQEVYDETGALTGFVYEVSHIPFISYSIIVLSSLLFFIFVYLIIKKGFGEKNKL